MTTMTSSAREGQRRAGPYVLRPATGRVSPRVRWVFAGLLVASAALTLWAAKGASFTADEWGYLLDSVHATPATVLDPVVGHLTALLILTYHALYGTVGLAHNWPYRAVSTATHLLCCALLFAYARRRVGDIGALLATLPILFLGTGADTFLTLHQAAPVGSLTAGLAALLALDRRQRRWDAVACIMLVLAVAGDTEGVILTAAILLEVLLERGSRSRVWIPLIPLLLFIGWAIGYNPLRNQGLASTSSPKAVLDRATYAFHAGASAVAGLAGVQLSSPTLHRHFPAIRLAGHVLLVGWVAAAIVRVARRGLTPRIVTFILTLLGYWVVLALARGGFTGSPYQNRYVFVGALLLVLLTVELLQGVRLSSKWQAVVAFVVVVCTCLNVVWVIVDGRFKTREGAIVRAELGALEISRDTVSPTFQPDSNIRLVDVRAGRYFEAVAKYRSSPADSPAALGAAPEPSRVAADAVLIRALGVSLLPVSNVHSPNGQPPVTESIRGGTIQPAGACLVAKPAGPLSSLDVRVPRGGMTIQTAPHGVTFVWVRRFGPLPPRPLGVVRQGRVRLRAPLGRASASWHARVVTTRQMVVCSTA